MNRTTQPITMSLGTIIKITLTVISVLLGLLVLNEIRGILIFLLVAIIFASAMKPAVDAAGKRGIPRGLAVAGIYLSVILFLAGISAVVIPPIVSQVSLLAQNTPGYYNDLQAFLIQYAQSLGLSRDVLDLNQLSAQANSVLPILAGGIFRYTLNTFSAILGVLSVMVVSYYWLAERSNIGHTWATLLPAEQRSRGTRVWRQIEGRWGGWLRGQIALCVIIGVCSLLGNTVLGVRYAGVLALIAGLTEAIPTVGPIIGAIPAIALALTDSPQKGLAVAVLYFLIQQLENAILVPKIMERSVGLSPLTVLLSVLVGAALLGIAGALLAVPVASAIHVIVTELLFRKPDEQPAHEPDAATVASPGMAIPAADKLS